MHVSFHQLCDDVDVLVVSLCGRLGYIKHFDNVFVVKELEQANFSHNTLGIDEIFEGLGNFLNGNFLVGDVVIGAADDTISTVADLLDVLKLIFDAESRA